MVKREEKVLKELENEDGVVDDPDLHAILKCQTRNILKCIKS